MSTSVTALDRARAEADRLEMLRNTVSRARDIPPDKRTDADLALLAAAPDIAAGAIGRLGDLAAADTARPGTEERQVPLPPRPAPPFPGPLAARASRLPVEGFHAAYAVLDGTVTASTVPEGQEKPVSAVSVSEAMVRAEAIVAAAGPVSRQALADTDARARIEAAARRAIAVELDRQALAVIADDPEVPAVNAGSVTEAVRLAALQLQAAGYAGLTVAGPPELLAAVDPASLPAGLTLTAADGTGVVVADLAAALGLALRGDITVYESETVGDAFLRNEVYLLAEVPAKPAVTDAAAARKITGGTP